MADGAKEVINFFFRFNLDEGKNYGIGHAIRILNIYNELKNNKYKFFFVINNSSFAINFLIKNKISDKIIIKGPNELLNKYFLFNNSKNILIFDTLGCDKNLISKVKLLSKNIKIISLEDIINFKKCDLTINSKLSTKLYLNRKIANKFNVLQGSKYMILEKKLFLNRKKRYLAKKNNYKLLICTGGGDYRHLNKKIANILCEEPKYNLSFLIGPGVKKSNPIYKISYKYSKNIKLISNTKNIKKAVLSNDLILTTGGTTMFEAMCLGKSVISIESFAHQHSIIRFYEKKNCINNIGDYRNINKKSLLKQLTEITNHIDKTNVKLSNAFNCFDGLELKRVMKQINKIINY